MSNFNMNFFIFKLLGKLSEKIDFNFISAFILYNLRQILLKNYLCGVSYFHIPISHFTII